jgi:RimJ/RimL family protein N-acetyltransferase
VSETILMTARLQLRTWRPEDLPVFAEMNSDPRVMEFLPKLLSREESDRMAARIQQFFDRDGFGMWAVEAPGIASFLGFVGLWRPDFDVPFTPCVEVGWRLAFPFWGRGYATEAARAALTYGFEVLALPEIVSFTPTINDRSRRVMERLGMIRRCEDDFDLPIYPAGHPLSRHVLYRLAAGAPT